MGGGGLASHFMAQGAGSASDSFNGAGGRQQLPGLALSFDSTKPQLKRTAASAPSSGPLKKAPRLEIPEQGLLGNVQVARF